MREGESCHATATSLTRHCYVTHTECEQAESVAKEAEALRKENEAMVKRVEDAANGRQRTPPCHAIALSRSHTLVVRVAVGV